MHTDTIPRPRARKLMMGDVNDDRRLILRGAIDKVNANTKKPTFKLIIFSSSTFTDTQHGRDVLMDSLLFELRDVAENYEIEVIIVDLRTGVRDESTLDQETWIVCSECRSMKTRSKCLSCNCNIL